MEGITVETGCVGEPVRIIDRRGESAKFARRRHWWTRTYDRLKRLWHRRPRIISYDDYMKLTRQFPAEQRRNLKLRKELRRLLEVYGTERRNHRAKIADAESLKTLIPTRTLNAWKRRRRRET